ncbi:MAG: Na/Pi cotransporter family protein [Lachnospiraceae bacterium]|nr:Na/Pi cotransporter family protein [Lachnospiraceae bacterium]
MELTLLLDMAGGLGLFLFGMTLMSEGIEKAAGAKLRGILEAFTKNRVVGMLVGVIFTALVQSSSACTVLIVTFVNSGLMTLYQAAGPIFGANIGTTVTAQLVSFNLSKYAPLFLFVGVVTMLAVKNNTVKKWAEVLAGFGILFLGLSMMSSAMSMIKDSQTVIELLSSLSSPVKALILGTALTALVQSSSVTVAIILLMANQGLLELDICMFMILGCNIGACASAMLAGFTGRKDAKRTALIHLLFNIIGTIIMCVVLALFMDQVLSILWSFSANPGRVVANAHLTFKVVQVMLLLPFSNKIVDLTYLLVPGEDDAVGYRATYQLQYIGEKNMFSPATAVVEASKELDRMGALACENLNRSMNALITLDQEDIDEAYDVEKNIDFLNHAITDYLVKINQTGLPVEDTRSIGNLFHVANDIERIGDHAENIADCAVMRKEQNISISPQAQRELGEILEMVNDILHYSMQMFSTGDDSRLEDIVRLEEAIDRKERQLQNAHVERLARNECTPEAGMIFSDIVSGLERVGDHAMNIAIATLDEEEQIAVHNLKTKIQAENEV